MITLVAEVSSRGFHYMPVTIFSCLSTGHKYGIYIMRSIKILTNSLKTKKGLRHNKQIVFSSSNI